MMTYSTRMAARSAAVVFAIFLVAACSDDTETTGGKSTGHDCAVGESFNKLSGRCEPVLTDPNNDSSDAGTQPDGTGDHPDVDGDAADDSGGQTDPTDPPKGCGPGAVMGKACAPSGAVLVGANVTIEGVDCDGNAYSKSVQTDANGKFDFENVPSGQHTLTISTGSFSRDQPIIVQNGETLDLTTAAGKVCLDGGNVDMAVIDGIYDHVAGLLDDLQLDYTVEGGDGGRGGRPLEPTVAFLTDLSAMNQYDIIFINCGELWNNLNIKKPAKVQPIIDNLKAYLDNGHSLYVSDWAYPFIEKVYPDAINFFGDSLNLARAGYAPQTVAATVSSPGLKQVLGTSQATIEYPHDPPDVLNNNWAVIEDAGAASTVHLKGDVTLCRRYIDCANQPPGQTVTGSPLLVTYKAASGGTVIYTTFHNERQSTLNDDMDKILKFLVFQL